LIGSGITLPFLSQENCRLPIVIFVLVLKSILEQFGWDSLPDSCRDFAGRYAFKPLKRGFYHIFGFILDFTLGEGQKISILISGATFQRFPL
jgi:hypothetical protein